MSENEVRFIGRKRRNKELTFLSAQGRKDRGEESVSTDVIGIWG